jgi:hypothetical protein
MLVPDVWPLRRGSGWLGPSTKALVSEKTPYLLLTMASCALTWAAQSQGGADCSDHSTGPLGSSFECLHFALPIRPEILLAGSTFCPLPPGGMAALARDGGSVSHRGRRVLGSAAPPKCPRSRHRMALVRRLSGARHRPGPGGEPIHGGPLHLSASSRSIHPRGLVCRQAGHITSPAKYPLPFFACLLVALTWQTQRQLPRWRNGETFFLHSLSCDPGNLDAASHLAWAYATDPDPALRNVASAQALAKSLTGMNERDDPALMIVLAAAQAESS